MGCSSVRKFAKTQNMTHFSHHRTSLQDLTHPVNILRNSLLRRITHELINQSEHSLIDNSLLRIVCKTQTRVSENLKSGSSFFFNRHYLLQISNYFSQKTHKLMWIQNRLALETYLKLANNHINVIVQQKPEAVMDQIECTQI